MKKVKKLIVILIFILICLGIRYNVNASETDNFDMTVFEDTSNISETDVDNLIKNTSSTTVALLRIASITVATVALLLIAMKYMIASPGDKADIKKHAIAYLVGTTILFAATQIIAVLIDIASKISE